MKTKILLAIVFLGNTLLFGQTGGIITGKISNHDSKEGISFARIILKKDGRVLAGAVADIDGNYAFSSLSAGVYTLKTSARGYSGYTVLNLLVDSEMVSEDMAMDPNFTAYDVPLKEEPIAELVRSDSQEDVLVTDETQTLNTPEQVSRSLTRESASVEDVLNTERVLGAMPSNVTIYPNPVHENASIEIASDTDIEGGIVRLYDIFGTEVKTFSFIGNTAVFEREGLAAGIYVYQINAANASIATGKMLLL